MATSPDHRFYHTSADGDSTEGTVLITDNFSPAEFQGTELFIEVSEANGTPVASYGLLSPNDGQASAASIPRAEVEKLRDFLTVWLTFAGPGEPRV